MFVKEKFKIMFFPTREREIKFIGLFGNRGFSQQAQILCCNLDVTNVYPDTVS